MMKPIDYEAVRKETSYLLGDTALQIIDGQLVHGWYLEVDVDHQGDEVYILRVVDRTFRYYIFKQRRKDAFVDISILESYDLTLYHRIVSGELQA